MSTIVVTPITDIDSEKVKLVEAKLAEVTEPLINFPITRMVRDYIMAGMRETLMSLDPPLGASLEYEARDNTFHFKIF